MELLDLEDFEELGIPIAYYTEDPNVGIQRSGGDSISLSSTPSQFPKAEIPKP